MDYYQGVVLEFLRADRSSFVNTEFLLQLGEEKEAPKGTYWFVDIMIANTSRKVLYLGEITFSQTQYNLLKKLLQWAPVWTELQAAVRRDTGTSPDWFVEPWFFVPSDRAKQLRKNLPHPFKQSRITALENTVPWLHHNHKRSDDKLEQIID